MSDTPGHFNVDSFRAHAHEVVDWIADYWAALESGKTPGPVMSAVAPGQIAAMLPTDPPEQGESWESIMGDVDRVVMPGITHWQSPHFFAYFPANSSAPGMLGDMISTGLGVNGMLWATSPAATEIETRMLDWMAKLIGLPSAFLSTSGEGGGVIQGTASEATLIGMLAARRRLGTMAGRSGGREAVYASTQAHSSIVKGAMIAGIADGPEDKVGVRLIGTDASFAMDADALERAIHDDVSAGRRPTYVCATVGTTSSTAIDPVRRIGAICKRHGLWLHVDAAFAGAACVCPEYRRLLDGVELADSVCFNPHKWLLTTFDCDLMWTRDKRSLVGALSVTPEYLRNAASDAGAVIDYRDWQIPLGRRFRALKLWFVLRQYGAEGLRSHIREHMRIAGELESWVRQDDRFEVVAPRTLSLVCFRLKGTGAEGDARNKRLLEASNRTGRVYLTHTVLPGVGVTLRMAIGGTLTREEHVREAWGVVRGSVA